MDGKNRDSGKIRKIGTATIFKRNLSATADNILIALRTKVLYGIMGHEQRTA